MSLNVLMISVEMIKARTGIHENIDEKLIFPEIKAAQDMYIHPALGTALYDKILTDINASGTTTGQYKTLLDNYIVDALIYYTIAQLPEALSFQFWNKGVVRKQGDSTELPSMTELLEISDKYMQRAVFYRERLVRYLKQNASTTVLPEYLSPGNGIDTVVPVDKSWSMPIYLGGSIPQSLDKNNCNCNGE
jgi:hypothetical protein